MKKFFSTIRTLLLLLPLCAVPIFVFLVALRTLKLLQSTQVFFVLFGGLLVMIMVAVLVFGIMPSTKISQILHPSKFRKWLERNSPNLFIGYILFILACVSVQDKLIFDSSTFNNLLVVQWMIFTISVAVFLAYWGQVKPYLKEIRPSQMNNQKGIERIQLLTEKKIFYLQIGEMLSPIRFLTINLIILISTTSAAFLVFGLNIYTQAIAIFSFYLSANSLCMIFQGITVPIKREIKAMMKEAEVSEDEYRETMLKATLEEIGSVDKVPKYSSALNCGQQKRRLSASI